MDRAKIVDGTRVKAGDVALGVASSGLHSNGYSLARDVLFERMKLAVTDRPAALQGRSVGDALLAPTRLYARHVKAMLASVDVHAMCHVTGGGLPGNLPRVLPDGLGLAIAAPWPTAPIFGLIARGGPVEEAEMRRTFNQGVGYVFVVAEDQAAAARAVLAAEGDVAIELGRVVAVPADRPFEARVEWPSFAG